MQIRHMIVNVFAMLLYILFLIIDIDLMVEQLVMKFAIVRIFSFLMHIQQGPTCGVKGCKKRLAFCHSWV